MHIIIIWGLEICPKSCHPLTYVYFHQYNSILTRLKVSFSWCGFGSLVQRELSQMSLRLVSTGHCWVVIGLVDE